MFQSFQNILTRRCIVQSGSVGLAGLVTAVVARETKANPNSEIPSLIAATPNHPNVAVVQRYYQLYGASNFDTIRREIFAPNITWTIPGHHPLAGTKKGADEVFAFLQQLGKAKFRAEVLFLGGNDSYVVDVHRGWSNMEANNIDQLWALLFRIENGQIVEAINFPGDQHAADAFFWRVYPLKPIPERLA